MSSKTAGERIAACLEAQLQSIESFIYVLRTENQKLYGTRRAVAADRRKRGKKTKGAKR